MRTAECNRSRGGLGYGRFDILRYRLAGACQAFLAEPCLFGFLHALSCGAFLPPYGPGWKSVRPACHNVKA